MSGGSAERPLEKRVRAIHRIGEEKRAGLIPNLIERLDLDGYPGYEARLTLDRLANEPLFYRQRKPSSGREAASLSVKSNRSSPTAATTFIPS